MPSPVTVELLFAPGCETRRSTRAMVEGVARQRKIPLHIKETVVRTPEEAGKKKFLGSPSVRVNGEDVEPGAHGRTDFGLG